MDESPIMGHRKQGRVLYRMTNLDLRNVDEPSKSGGGLTTFSHPCRVSFVVLKNKRKQQINYPECWITADQVL
jgi:hypothetical protein